MDRQKIIKCVRILQKLNSMLENEFDENGMSEKFNIWSARYDKISSYHLAIFALDNFKNYE